MNLEGEWTTFQVSIDAREVQLMSSMTHGCSKLEIMFMAWALTSLVAIITAGMGLFSTVFGGIAGGPGS